MQVLLEVWIIRIIIHKCVHGPELESKESCFLKEDPELLQVLNSICWTLEGIVIKEIIGKQDEFPWKS